MIFTCRQPSSGANIINKFGDHFIDRLGQVLRGGVVQFNADLAKDTMNSGGVPRA
jgi:hypothetical protein